MQQPEPEVVFYVLASSSQHERQDFACKLIEKIYRGGQFCYVLTDDEHQASDIDRQLWVFRVGSFVPHQRYHGQPPAHPGNILIGGSAIPDGWQTIIVNLSSHYPQITDATERIVEILDNSEASKNAGRERYRHYREAGLSIITHKQEAGRWVELTTRQ
ncbi:MAG: DNA polymerase III subunit chi [Methylomonas sp.]|nr:DNA polymerase III subunit chi [Methylomonas sp.]PPD20028.1 MAG: DNA polymerase III subunit chi [Methylomonas sp.]PPD25891.1 MAG: DNA polymerase III subunit chi [Methylomonas sp.]PPD37337.1 MAG: DNA polymerase III subunit chi [Methylomonas sp.]PPD40121.1 MAG: DNA polymerase III subunit chi [Methylomonas sp.]